MENPRNSASFLSEPFLNWVTPFVWKGYKNEVTLNDLWTLNKEDSAKHQTDIFLVHLEKEFPPTNSTTRNGRRGGSLLKALVKTFWREFTLAGICKVMTDALNILGPLLMKVMLRYLGSDCSKWLGVGYAIAMFLLFMTSSVLANIYLGKVSELGMHIRVVLTAAIYRKSLRLSSVARREKTAGEIVNLISNDAQVLRDGSHRVHLLWSTPALIFAATAILYVDLGISVGAGMLFTFILVPISGFLASVQKKALARQKKDKDNRIRIMNEILTGIRVLKLYAWELGFKKLVDDVRAAELRKLRSIACVQAFLKMFWFFAPFAVTFVTFAAFTFLNHEKRLTAETAFTTLALYQSLRVPLIKLPDMISKLIQGIVSLKRLQDFFSADELEPYVRHDASSKDVICVEEAFFSWDQREPILRNINLKVVRGELLAVVGRVGDGKSSLISALLGDMNLLSGKVSLNGTVAYVSQQAWLRNATLRENILFGKPFDSQRYWDVMRRCALLEDIKVLPASDHTEIGERGINLSGGQKQRVSIARAVYADADIYLFDDPLSAVDSDVGLRIFSAVIGNEGILRDKTRILVTHGFQYLPKADRIVVMRDGYISRIGNFTELMNSQDDFRNLMQQFIRSEEDSVIDQQERKRRKSSLWIESELSDNDKAKGKIMSKEHAETGGVKSEIYCEYIKHIGYIYAFLVLLTMLASTAFEVSSSFWLKQWSKDKSTANGSHNLMIFGLLGMGQAFGLFFGVLFLVLSCLSAARKLHDSLLMSILRAPMSFFESTPIGRIVNRFARDVDVLDTDLPDYFGVWLQQVLSLVSILFVICYNLPPFIVVVALVGVLFHFIQLIYVSSSRQLRRLESITRSSIFSHSGETLQGSAIIRAFGKTSDFIKESEKNIDLNAMCYFPHVATSRMRLTLNSCIRTLGTLQMARSSSRFLCGMSDLPDRLVPCLVQRRH